jgi:hypothetical protein
MKIRKYLIILITSLILAIYAYILRYLFITYVDIDILDVINHPYLSILTLWSIATGRIVIASSLEYANFMDISDLLNPTPSSSDPPTAPSSGPSSDVKTEIIKGLLYINKEGNYVITDYNRVSSRGYIDPNTREPYTTGFKPYCELLSAALNNEYINDPLSSKVVLHLNKFDLNSRNFIREYLQWHNPTVREYNYQISRNMIKKIKNLP